METISVWIQEILSPSRFIAHGHCYLWQPQLVWLHVLSDALIGLSYFSIPIMLLYFVKKRKNFPFRGVLLLFSLFILTCGTTHLMSIWTLWHPAYWLAGGIKATTAITSVFTALTLLPTIPVALALPQPEALRRINQQLEKEIEERKQAEATLHYQIEFDRVVSEISARFVGISLDEIDDEITRSLQTIGQFMQVDTSYIFQIEADRATVSMRYEWVRDSKTAQIEQAQNLLKTDFPWAIDQLSKANILKVTDVQTLPSTASKEKQNWQTFNVRSLIAIPFIAQGKLLGWVGFASFNQTMDWSNNSAQLLKLLAEIFTRALQRQESEQALRQSEARLRMALEAGKTICWEYDLTTECVHGFGEIVEGVWQPSRWERTSADCQSNVYKDDRAKLHKAVEEAINTAGEFSIEHRLRRKSKDSCSKQSPKQISDKKVGKETQGSLEKDSYYWVLTKGKVLSGEKDGESSRMVALTVDVSKRKQTEAELQWSKDRWQLALRGTNDGIWDADLTTEQVFVSPRLREMLGYGVNEWGDKVEDWLNRIHPDDVEQVTNALHAHFHNETSFYMAEYRILCKGGYYKWVLDRGKAMRNRQGIAIRITGSLGDITDRKQAETELRQLNQQLEARVEERTAEVIKSEQRFRLLFESAPDFIYVLDRQGVIQQINSTVIARSGYLESELVGQPLSAFIREESTSIERGMTELLSTGHHRQEMALVCKDNRILMVDCSCTLFGGNANDDYILVLQRDITERHAVDRMKNEFISVVSHELRTPITSIHGALDLLDSGLVDPSSSKGQRVFGIAVESSDRLVKLVNDILELERLDSGKIRLNYGNISTRDLLKRCYELMELTAERAGITLDVTNYDLHDSDLQMWADGDRLIQVLTNLVGNAIKFSDAPATVWVWVEAADDGVKFTVQDEGRGIPEGKLDEIFERFHQVDASDSRRKGGTGLGLAICRSIVQQHGGHIWAESKLGEGSLFSFSLPAIYKHK